MAGEGGEVLELGRGEQEESPMHLAPLLGNGVVLRKIWGVVCCLLMQRGLPLGGPGAK